MRGGGGGCIVLCHFDTMGTYGLYPFEYRDSLNFSLYEVIDKYEKRDRNTFFISYVLITFLLDKLIMLFF